MSGSNPTRRAMLARGLAATGAVVASAGCSSLFGSDSGDTAVFTQWLPAPAALNNADHYRFDYYDLATLAANRDSLGGEPTVFERTWQPVGLGWADATAVVAVGSVDVVTAEFDREAAVSDLRGAGYDRAGEYKGYARYRNPETGTVFAIADGTLLVSAMDRYAPDAVDPSDRLQTVVDARTGDVDRYAEASEDMGALVEALGAGTLVRGKTMDDPEGTTARSGRFENLVAEGARSVVDGGTVEEKWVYLYDRPRDVDTATLERYVEDNDNSSGEVDAQFGAVEDISYTQEGRKGIITGTRDAGEYYS
ncbi:hypothetical protein EGH22_10070 [Halomicroarcula sp. F28]|uniref:hypothetical protein n=1 Tax=Haloarcula salinisoli TaxID=2487746 RepID=UPI001C735F5E|nr:hypothetical protein [Halomicroarcula salinisoli]MBX0286674.1 hypothetical protein [Halomicroarcula salinisoli]